MRSKPRLGPAMEFIDQTLPVDEEAPRKQQHRTHRIWQRIVRNSRRAWWGSEAAALRMSVPETPACLAIDLSP